MKETKSSMSQPPRGRPMLRPNKAMDEADAEILKQLAEDKRCQQRIITDGGHHYVYCGGYFHGPAVKTKKGYRCTHHIN